MFFKNHRNYKKETEMKNTLTGIKNKLEEINITLDEAQYLTSNLEDKVLEQSEQEKKLKDEEV